MWVISRTARSYTLPVLIGSRLPKPDQMLTLGEIWVELADGCIVKIPNGFVTDCHSTPLWLAALLPEYDNRTNVAAITHDYLYMHWERFAAEQGGLMAIRLFDGRGYADRAYLELMRRFCPHNWRNRLYYAAVRGFGWWNWRKFRAQAA